MRTPSTTLLCALRRTEIIRTSLPLQRQPAQISKGLSGQFVHRRQHSPCLGYSLRTLIISATHRAYSSNSPRSTDRGPASTESTQTDFGNMDVFSNSPAPTASIDACTGDGFHLDNGVKIADGSGLLLVGGEAFRWRPWEAGGKGRLVNGRGQWDVGDGAWGILGAVWPKPDLLILGLGPSMRPIAPEVRKNINSLGIRVDVQDTRNAAAQFNLLATERGVGNVAAALIPIGWKEPR